MDELRNTFKTLINQTLPATFRYPVCNNHCFNRIILDWLFGDAWYHYLNKKTAISQLSTEQLEADISRMNAWLTNANLLVEDNLKSLEYRRKLRNNI